MIEQQNSFIHAEVNDFASDGWAWTKIMQLDKQNETRKDEGKEKNKNQCIPTYIC